MPLSPQARKLRAKIARAEQLDRDTDDLRRQFRYVTASDYIRDLVESAPPLTDEQVARLSRLLAGKVGAA